MENRSSDYILQFMTECYAGHGLDHMLKTAYKYFENPLALYDVSYRVIGYIGGETLDDHFWNESVAGGFTEKTLTAFMEDGLLSRQFKTLYPSFLPTMFTSPLGIVRRLGIAIPSADGTLGGWVSIFEHNRAFEDLDSSMLLWYAKILAPQMEALTTGKTVPLGRIENLMLDILNESTDLADTKKRLLFLGWKPLSYNRVLVIQSNENDIPKAMQEYIVLMLSEHTKDCVSFCYNGRLVAVISSQRKLFPERMTNELVESLKKFDLRASFSASFQDVTELKHHYMQAENCLTVNRIRKNPERLVYFEDHAIDIMILMASQKFNISEFCHPFLFSLCTYDQQQNTEFLDTLRQYVFNTGNLKAAAQELGIHRNTLSYRMEKIQDILGVETFDQKLLADLYMSFIVFDIMNLGKSTSLNS